MKQFIFFIIISSLSCKHKIKDAKKSKVTPTVTNFNIPTRKTVITIQPFFDLSKNQLDYITQRLHTVLPNIETLQRVQFPNEAYYKPRNRQRADILIKWLSNRTSENHVTVGLTSKDISTTKGNIYDWGVMGLGYEPGNACIASSFRLKTYDEFFKVVIHEIGHTQGLPHCPLTTCFMRDAEGGNTTGEEKKFCASCKEKLRTKGWRL